MPLSLLLNPRVWIVIVLCVLELAVVWKAYVMGGEHTQLAFDAYVNQQAQNELIAEQTARSKEHEMQSANQKVSQNYESLKAATATAVSALDADRLRLQAALDRHAPGDPAAQPGVDAAAEVRILGQCLQRYEDVAGDADRLADKVTALQDYIRSVVAGR